MGEKQPIGNNPRDTQSIIKADKPLSQPETKPFNGAVIGGVFMSPHPELTSEQEEGLKEKIRNIQQHRS